MIAEFLRFLTRRWSAEFPDAVLQLDSADPQKHTPWRTIYVAPRRLDDAVAWVVAENSKGRNVYAGVNPRRGDINREKSAKDGDIVGALFQFADMDQPSTGAIAVWSDLQACVVVVTGTVPSERRHVYWERENVAGNLSLWSQHQRSIARTLGSDGAVTDARRIMRIAGTISYPGPKKEERGYRIEQTQLLSYGDAAPVSDDWLAEHFPSAHGVATDDLDHGNAGKQENVVRHPVEVEAMIATIRANTSGWHDAVLRLLGHCVSAGWPDEAMFALAPRITLDGYTLDQTRVELTPMIAGARDKGWAPPMQDENEASLKAKVAELAKLSLLQYDRGREAAAERLGIRLATLDKAVACARGEGDTALQGRALRLPEPQPWPEPVDGDDLLQDLVKVIRSYVVVPPGEVLAVALWVLHAHAFAASRITPRLAITSPQRRCGKSTLLDVIERLVPKPLKNSNITAAAIFRTIEAARPTLLIDEGDSFLPENEELRGVLNSGHTKGGSVIRLVGDNHEPRQFSTWSAVAIALIGKLSSTLADRSVPISMQRRGRDEPVARLREDRVGTFSNLARRCARWAADHLTALRDADPSVPEQLNDRAADNWRPLLAIADAIGGEFPRRARDVAISQANREKDDSFLGMLLEDIREIFDKNGLDRISSEDLCRALAEREDRPWPEWKHGKPITKVQLAKLLAPVNIKPGTIRLPEGTAKGYYFNAFADVFSRYLSSDPHFDPSHRHNTWKSSGNGRIQPVTTEIAVTDRNIEKPKDSAGCDGVTDQNGDREETEEEWTA
jgi:putative DNA primase/helicase